MLAVVVAVVANILRPGNRLIVFIVMVPGMLLFFALALWADRRRGPDAEARRASAAQRRAAEARLRRRRGSH
jgi:hypothetical protein